MSLTHTLSDGTPGYGLDIPCSTHSAPSLSGRGRSFHLMLRSTLQGPPSGVWFGSLSSARLSVDHGQWRSEFKESAVVWLVSSADNYTQPLSPHRCNTSPHSKQRSTHTNSWEKSYSYWWHFTDLGLVYFHPAANSQVLPRAVVPSQHERRWALSSSLNVTLWITHGGVGVSSPCSFYLCVTVLSLSACLCVCLVLWSGYLGALRGWGTRRAVYMYTVECTYLTQVYMSTHNPTVSQVW